ncbi:MAG: hypothetical protein ACJ74O_06990 [Frankiaceae bacterium]
MKGVVLVSGHLVDAPDRPAPRFPPSRVEWVTERVRDALAGWRTGPGTTVITGGARGADIIAAEEGRARGAHVVLCLALPPREFERQSVELPGTDWSRRFRALLDVVEVRELAAEVDDVPEGDEVFARTNAWMVELAKQLDDEPCAIVVWNGRTGDGPGGTSDMVARLGYDLDDPHVRVIDPTPPEQEAGRSVG